MASKRQRLILGATIIVALFSLLELHYRANNAVQDSNEHTGQLIATISQDRTAGKLLSRCIVQSLGETLHLDYTLLPYLAVSGDDLRNEFTRRPRARRKTVMLLTARRLAETCFKLDSFHILRPCAEDTMCPCESSSSECLSIGDPQHCSTRLPIGMETKVVHFIRNPIDLVLASYATLSRKNAASTSKQGKKFGMGRNLLGVGQGGLELEKLDTLDMGEFAERMVAYKADQALLDKLSVGDVPGDTLYMKYLKSLPPSKGVQLEFLRMAPSLFAEARQYIRNNRTDSGVLRVRVEDFENNFDETVREVLRFVDIAQSTEDNDDLESAVRSNCDVSGGDYYSLNRWQQTAKGAKQQVAADPIVKQSQDNLNKITKALLSEPVSREALCGLSQVFGYADHRCFKEAGSTELPAVKAAANATGISDKAGEESTSEDAEQTGFSLDFSKRGGSLFKPKNELSDLGLRKRHKKKAVKDYDRLADLGQFRAGDFQRNNAVGEENPFD